MNQNKKQIAINLIASILSFTVSFAITFFLTPYIVEKIGRETYDFVGLAYFEADSFYHCMEHTVSK